MRINQSSLEQDAIAIAFWESMDGGALCGICYNSALLKENAQADPASRCLFNSSCGA
jgi:hypothetical protein